jgi:branched-chain amino acid transport system permease protein
MSLSKPSDYPDKGLVWYEYYDRRRRAEIKRLLTEEVIAEHEANPLGYRNFHSPALQRVLNYFRAQPILGKYFVYASEPWKEYRIAAVVERGRPARVFDEPVFATEEEAMHGVFMRRVEELRASTD